MRRANEEVTRLREGLLLVLLVLLRIVTLTLLLSVRCSLDGGLFWSEVRCDITPVTPSQTGVFTSGLR